MQTLTPAVRDGGPRQLHIRKKDLEKEDGTYDHTPGCKGCEALMVGLPSATHNMTCRNKLMERLKGTEEGQKSLADVEKRQQEVRRKDEEGESRSNRIARSDGTKGEIVGSLGITRGRNGH